MTEATHRSAAIDFLKAAAALSVVWIHAFLTLSQAQAGIVLFLGVLTRFAVPAFLFASGFLAHRGAPIAALQLARRLRRILVPYAIASLLAIAARWWATGPIAWRHLAWELLSGDAIGIYYFIVPLLAATLLIVPLSRWPGAAAPLLVVTAVAAWLSERGTLAIRGANPLEALFWNQRNPLRWVVYFIAGWFLAEHAAAVSDWSPRRRRDAGVALLALSCALAAGSAWGEVVLDSAVAQLLVIAGATLGIVLIGWERRVPAPVRWLSDATYPIYLYHFFFVAALRFCCAGALRDLPDAVAGGVTFAVALLGSLLLVAAARRVVGRSAARLVVG